MLSQAPVGGWNAAVPPLRFAFTDAAGRHWIRRATGTLESISSEPVRHYGLSEPVDWTELEELQGAPCSLAVDGQHADTDA